MKYFEVFKAGNYPQGKFTKEEIQELAKNYDPSFCEAPITAAVIKSAAMQAAAGITVHFTEKRLLFDFFELLRSADTIISSSRSVIASARLSTFINQIPPLLNSPTACRESA